MSSSWTSASSSARFAADVKRRGGRPRRSRCRRGRAFRRTPMHHASRAVACSEEADSSRCCVRGRSSGRASESCPVRLRVRGRSRDHREAPIRRPGERRSPGGQSRHERSGGTCDRGRTSPRSVGWSTVTVTVVPEHGVTDRREVPPNLQSPTVLRHRANDAVPCEDGEPAIPRPRGLLARVLIREVACDAPFGGDHPARAHEVQRARGGRHERALPSRFVLG